MYIMLVKKEIIQKLTIIELNDSAKNMFEVYFKNRINNVLFVCVLGFYFHLGMFSLKC